MEITISLRPELQPKVEQAASRSGRDVARFIEELVERAVSGASRTPALDEILAPARQQFVESGVTEEELDAIIKAERRAMRFERVGQKP